MTNVTVEKLYKNMGFDQPVLLKKALEYYRMLQMKSNFQPVTETFKAAVCLDLAATQMGIAFDKNEGKNFANTSVPSYKNMYHTIEKILGLDRCITVSELCVQLGIMSVSKTAEKLLNTYKQLDNIEKDFEHPQYVTAAVSTACHLKNLKVNKTQFINLSKIKARQWRELEAEFLKFAENNGMKADINIKNLKKKNNQLADMLDAVIDDNIADERKPLHDEPENIESYECWKKRILDEAYKGLKKKAK